MKDVYVKSVKKLKTKETYNVFHRARNTGFVAKERLDSKTTKWYPFYVNSTTSAVAPKYTYIKFIGTKNNMVPNAGFSRTASAGYGFTNAQGVSNFFRQVDKTMQVQGIFFTETPTMLKDGILDLNFKDFHKIRIRSMQLLDSKRIEEEHAVKEAMHQLIPEDFRAPRKLMYTPGSLGRVLEKYAPDSFDLSENEAKQLKSVLLGSNLSPELLVSTRKEIQKVYIEDVLQQYKDLMLLKSGVKVLEEKWHQFFKTHTWIFSQIFAFPAVFFNDKVNVGGQDFSGKTDKIIDFLYKNEFTNNLAFIEIKTHKTPLVNSAPYRKPDIYAVSKDVTGAMIQVLDQKNRLLKNFHSRKGSTEIESFSSTCLIIIGSIEMLKSKDKKDSFEIFRSGNTEIIIVTFDELLKKISTLLEIFTKK